MPDEPQNPAVNGDGEAPPPPEAAQPVTEESTVIQDPAAYYRAQAEKNERLFKKMEAELNQLKQAEDARQQAEALARGEHEKVIAQLEPKAKRADELETVVNSILEQELTTIPEQFRGLVPDGDAASRLAWINTARASGLFDASKQAPPILNAGDGTQPPARKAVKLTEQERQMAKVFGMTEEEYAKHYGG